MALSADTIRLLSSKLGRRLATALAADVGEGGGGGGITIADVQAAFDNSELFAPNGPLFHPGAWEALDAATFPTGVGFLNIDGLSVPYEIEMHFVRAADSGDTSTFITLSDQQDSVLMDQTEIAPANAGDTTTGVRAILPADHGARFLASGDVSGFSLNRFRRRPLVA
jgi:hypothetical protein